MGACADIGHWVRSGLDPIECLQLLEGRVISFHIKDMNKFGVRSAHDVPWGTGYSNIPAVMREMKKQGFKGVYSIEYEHHWENNVPEIQESLKYFYRVRSEEHTSELQSLMRISYDVFCLKKQKKAKH